VLLAELPVLLRDATKRHNALLLVNKKASTIVAIRKAAALAAEAATKATEAATKAAEAAALAADDTDR
jgi:hypothetical protein